MDEASLIAAVNAILGKKFQIMKPPAGLSLPMDTEPDDPAIMVKCIEVAFEECIYSSLTMENVESTLNLANGYINDFMFFSSFALKILIDFVLTSSGRDKEKNNVMDYLRDQLRNHPADSKYMERTYDTLLLEKEEHFNGKTLMDYVLVKLEKTIQTRRLQSTPRPLVVGAKGKRRAPKSLKNLDYVDGKDYEELAGTKLKVIKSRVEDAQSLEQAQQEIGYVTKVLEFLIDVLVKNLHGRCNRGDLARETIIGRMVFKFNIEQEADLDDKFLCRVFELCRRVEKNTQRVVLQLIKVIGETCMIHDTKSVQPDFRFLKLENTVINCERLCIYFCESALTRITEEEGCILTQRIPLSWLKYYAAMNLLKRRKKQSSFGLQLILDALRPIVEKIEPKPEATKLLFKDVDGDVKPVVVATQVENTEGDKNTVKRSEHSTRQLSRTAFKQLTPDFATLLLLIADGFISISHIRDVYSFLHDHQLPATTIHRARKLVNLDYEFYKQELQNYTELKSTVAKINEYDHGSFVFTALQFL